MSCLSGSVRLVRCSYDLLFVMKKPIGSGPIDMYLLAGSSVYVVSFGAAIEPLCSPLRVPPRLIGYSRMFFHYIFKMGIRTGP